MKGKKWFDAHATLEEGVSDFSHFSIDRVGHAIHEEAPEFVIEHLERLIELVA